MDVREPTLLSFGRWRKLPRLGKLSVGAETVSLFRKGIDDSLQRNLPVGPGSALLLLLGNSPVSNSKPVLLSWEARNLS